MLFQGSSTVVSLENLMLVAQLVKSTRCTGVSLLLTANFHPQSWHTLLAAFYSSPQKYLNTHTLYCDLPTQAAPLWTWLLSKDTSECFCVWLWEYAILVIRLVILWYTGHAWSHRDQCTPNLMQLFLPAKYVVELLYMYPSQQGQEL